MFEVGRRFRCTMRVDCGQLDPGAVIRPVPGVQTVATFLRFHPVLTIVQTCAGTSF
jgi:hypothetical protein